MSIFNNKEEKVILNYSKQLKEQIAWIDKLINQTEKEMKTVKILDDRSVRTSKRKNGYQYYLVNDEGKLEYVKQKDMDNVRGIVQRDYYKELKEKLLTTRYRIDRFDKIYDIDALQRVYMDLSDARKALVTPIILPDDEFIKNWRENNRGGMNPFPEDARYQTTRGEFVRSKSEKIIADLFANMEVPYIYEPQLKFADGKVVYPDFALLNTKTRKTIYWEHFGLISDGDYAKGVLNKLSFYEKAGLVIGKDVIFSMESKQMPLDVQQVKKKIREYLK